MAFIARVEKPCTQCGVTIPKGTASGFTWDRSKGGFIHLECMKARKGGPSYDVEHSYKRFIEILARTYGVKPEDVGMDESQWTGELVIDAVQRVGNKYALAALPAKAIPLPAATDPVKMKPNGNGVRAAEQLAKLIQSLAGQRGIDEQEVRRIAADEAAKVSSNRSISISVGEMPEIKLDLAHKDLPLLIKLASAYGANGHRQNIYMHGPAGSGKSTAAKQAAEVLQLAYGYISLNPQTPDSRLLGYMHAGGEYVKSEFFTRYTDGGVFCIDEIDNSSASLVTTLNGLLENGHGAFPHGVFSRHKDFICICTANTIGRGGDVNYPERRALDGAFLERFLFLEWEYDNDLTKAIVASILGNTASEFMSWVKSEAKDLQAKFPTLIVSPRAYIQGAVLEKMGLTRNQIIPMVVSRGLR